MAIFAAVITLVAAGVGWLHLQASDRSSTAGRAVQDLAIEHGARDVRNQAAYQYQIDVRALAAELDQRSLLARQRARQGVAAEQLATFQAQVQLYTETRASVLRLSPVLERAERGVAARDDPSGAQDQALAQYVARLEQTTDTLELRRAAASEQSSAWGARGDAYIAVLALFAVALFLIGLSLAISHELRNWLVGPAVALFLAGVAWTLSATTNHIPTTPRSAIDAVAAGERRLAVGDASGANRAFGKALATRSDYGQAHARRADALLELATRPIGEPSVGTLVVRDRRKMAVAIAEYEAARRLGAATGDTLERLGYLLGLADHDDDAVKASSAAADASPSDPSVWLNLAVERAALGDATGAHDAVARGVRLARAPRNATIAAAFFSGARTELERVAAEHSEQRHLVRALESQVTLGGFHWRNGKAPPRVRRHTVRAVGSPLFEVDGGEVLATRVVEAPKGTPIVYLWYTRARHGDPWTEVFQQYDIAAPLPAAVVDIVHIHVGSAAQPLYDPGPCGSTRELRLDAYAGGTRVASDVAVDVAGAPIRLESALKAPHVVRDRVLGLVACRPRGWRAAADPDAGAIVVVSPDHSVELRMGSLPLPFSPSQRADANTTALVDAEILELQPRGTLTRLATPRDATFAGAEGLLADYRIETPAGEIASSIGVSAGADGVLRFFVVTGPAARRSEVEALRDAVRFEEGPPVATLDDSAGQ
jgi:hypothetical protein